MKRITGVSERLLECARDEFLDKGFQSASIRDIAKKANTSARAVYTRFPNKEGLFDAIVLPISDGLVELYQNYADQFWLKNKENRSAAFASIDERSFPFAVFSFDVYSLFLDSCTTFLGKVRSYFGINALHTF